MLDSKREEMFTYSRKNVRNVNKEKWNKKAWKNKKKKVIKNIWKRKWFLMKNREIDDNV